MSMRADRIHGQRGIGLGGLLVVGVVLGCAALIGMRIVPSAVEYMAIERAVSKIASSGEGSVREMRSSFDKLAAVDDIDSIGGKDLKIERDGSLVTIAFQYEKRIPIYGPVSLLIDYHGKSSGFAK